LYVVTERERFGQTYPKFGREVYRVDPIADVESARRPAGYAAIPSRTQHPATSPASRQVLAATDFDDLRYLSHPLLTTPNTVTVIDNDFEILTIVVEPRLAWDDNRPAETIILNHSP
jgi:hypothetical protein